ncbi:MAG: hypothetical protein GY929_00605 [Actinomycetia bacterium]|nr:hypothetical protein [Actinomycetes bacterium]
MVLLALVVAAYTMARGLVESSAASARANAQSILDLERALGLDFGNRVRIQPP